MENQTFITQSRPDAALPHPSMFISSVVTPARCPVWGWSVEVRLVGEGVARRGSSQVEKSLILLILTFGVESAAG